MRPTKHPTGRKLVFMKIPKLDNFEKNNSPLRLFLILILSILICELFLKYLFVFVLKSASTNVLFLDSFLLIVILSPTLYLFFYRPFSKQFDELKKSEVIQRELALIDPLTGLYNRRGFVTYANHLLRLSNRTQRGLVLIYADLNNLKRINDAFGHESGDKVLVCMTKVLQDSFRKSDVIGRVGGDEFALLALEAKQESMDMLRKRLKWNLDLAVFNFNREFKLSVSLGIIYYDPGQPRTVEELLNSADMLMYEEKNSQGKAPI